MNYSITFVKIMFNELVAEFFFLVFETEASKLDVVSKFLTMKLM